MVRTIVLREDIAAAFTDSRQTLDTCMGSVLEYLTDFSKRSDAVVDLTRLEADIKKVVRASINLTDPQLSPSVYDVRFHYSPDHTTAEIEIGMALLIGATVAANTGVLTHVH